MHFEAKLSATERRRVIGVRKRKRNKESRIAELPEKLDVFIPESKLYTQLLRTEQRIEAAMTRTKLDIQDALNSPNNVYKVLRMFLSHSLSDDVRGFRLRVHGVLSDPETSNPTKDLYAARFSKFIRKVVVYLDPIVFPDGQSTIEWNRTEYSDEVDGFEVSRQIPQSIITTSTRIVLYLDDYPKRYKLPNTLHSALGLTTDTKSRIMSALWTYIKYKRLQDSKEPTYIICDDILKAAFEQERMLISDIADALFRLLSPPDPLVFQYNIDMDKSPDESRQVFDISVQIPELVDHSIGGFLRSAEIHRPELCALSSKIRCLIDSINERKFRYDLLSAFAVSPVDVIRVQLAHQARDMKTLADDDQARELQRHSAFFTEDWVPDAIDRYLQKQEQS